MPKCLTPERFFEVWSGHAGSLFEFELDEVHRVVGYAATLILNTRAPDKSWVGISFQMPKKGDSITVLFIDRALMFGQIRRMRRIEGIPRRPRVY